MFLGESLSERFQFSEDESQHFLLAEEEEFFSFPLSGFYSIERDHYAGGEKSNEYLAQNIEAGQLFTQTDDVQNSHADEGSLPVLNQELQSQGDSFKQNLSLHFLKKNGQKQKNPSPSKNFLLYAWKKVLKCLKLSNNPKLQQCWQSMKNQKGSLKNFNHLFGSLKTEEDFSAIFQSKILLHWLMLSPMDSFLKKAYLSFFRRLEDSHKKGYIHHLK